MREITIITIEKIPLEGRGLKAQKQFDGWDEIDKTEIIKFVGEINEQTPDFKNAKTIIHYEQCWEI